MTNSTICALATPPGGAISIIRISGDKAIEIADSIFSKDILNAPANKVIYGNIHPEVSDSDVIDDVLLTVFRAPYSYTGEDSIEISCHGSKYITKTILELLIKQGCTMAKPGEYTQRAFLNGKMDLSQAEAVADLIASTSASQHRIAMNQMRGGISNKLSQLRQQLLHLTSLLELELDFSEEDVEFADRTQLITIARDTEDEITRLSSSFTAGNAIKNGVPVAIIGAPNVGKSTLLNRLLHDDKAIVSDIQGTTRDIIEDTISIQGITFRFLDTAGIRDTEDKIEKMGIERAIKAAQQAHIIILMREPGTDFPDYTPTDNQIVIPIVNKSGTFQALNGIGIEELENTLVASVPEISENSVLIVNERHKQVLDSALPYLQQAISAMQNNLSGDLIAEDLNACITTLGEITGNISSDEVLGNIFKNFCIGK